MIPNRLSLEGFMCYREKTELHFHGSTIWALCGPNGVGKSAIFDAILYVLYGEHRLGRQHHDELIHYEAQEFVIEFDFRIGENAYRIRRGYSRKKRAIRMAQHLHGPGAPLPGRTGSQVIPETVTEKGFEDWIARTVGLDAMTFTVSVLLMQGNSDKLLGLEGSERHTVLTQLIDLSRYVSLHQRAVKHLKEEEDKVKRSREDLDALELVEEAHVLALQCQVEEAKKNKELARERQLLLAERKEQATRWSQVQQEEKELTESLKSYEDLLKQAEQIEQRASRLETLQSVVPTLIQIHSKQTEAANYSGQIEQDREMKESLEATLQEFGEKIHAANQLLKSRQAQQVEANEEQKQLQIRSYELEQTYKEITDLRAKQQRYQEFALKIASYPPDLEQQQKQLSEQIDMLEQLNREYPYLKQFVQARNNWHQSTQVLAEIEGTLKSHETVLEQVTGQKRVFLEKIKKSDEQLNTLKVEISRRKTLYEECQKRFDRFLSIDGQPTCSYCGQPLTEEHLAIERQNIEHELQETERSCHEGTTRVTIIQQEKQALQKELDQTSWEEEEQKKTITSLTVQQIKILGDQKTAWIQAETVLNILAPEYIELIQETVHAPIDVQICLHSTFPAPQHMQEFTSRLQEREPLRRRLRKIMDDMNRCTELVREQRYLLNDIRPLQQAYPPERIAALIQDRQQVQQRNDELLAFLDRCQAEIHLQEGQIRTLEGERLVKGQEHNRLEKRIAIAQMQLQNLQQAMEEKCKTLPGEWQARVTDLSESLLNGCQYEIEELGDAVVRTQELEKARQHSTYDQQRLSFLKAELDRFPLESRQSPELLQKEFQQVEQVYREYGQTEQKLDAELLRVKNVLIRRKELEDKWSKAVKMVSLYKELDQLLGQSGLQHFLLQKAEAGIVYHANEILDCISGGMLRLELRSRAERKVKALDLVVYNSAVGTNKAQAIRQLSGSQQFRVVVSLALGIGRYAGNDNHRVESVIIDEGFGSLDEKGRREMIQAIQDLGDKLKCIIVVSHQREFFDEFDNKYFIELVDGSTKVSLI